ncbi:amino acid deaminase/aldolase [Galactobacter valiniphilus]|uniref:Amino acid deaminase/aldolase n=1 Tax=Galactobacter valiniphilus TaxID=2676122 RepID=A0A399JFF2_9MICC|nr:alanine racemase [Galactobacter valiniphilus]RII43307.1 amino acid deaminase/aldolase [Galactobacter valiniphilus]
MPNATPQPFSGYLEALRAAGLDRRPVAILDLDAVAANVADLARRAAGKPLRLASKSLRSRAVLERVLADPAFAGLLCFTLAEALWLAEHGLDDLVIGYPTADAEGLRELAGNERARAAITLMIDSVEHLDYIDAQVPGHPELRVALELDASYRLGPGLMVGAARSPQHSAAELASLASAVVRRPGFALVGLMAYEGQIAGVGNAGRSVRAAAVRAMQAASARELATRRAEAVAAVRLVADLEFVNGGGTGSIESTAAEDAVTEIAAGSGVYGPGLFDHYTHFHPRHALHFGLDVVRRPAPDTATVLGGGWVASGAPGPDRLPTVAWPERVRFRGTEGAGEVQTPLVGEGAAGLRVGDVVWFRHAKAGELCERVNELALFEGGAIVGTVPTYRGEGKAFL